MKKLLAGIGLFSALFLTGCGTDDSTIRVGVVGGFNSHWQVVQDILDENGYDINIELVHFSDFMTPNLALSSGDLDLNAFQNHIFLRNELEVNNYAIEYIGITFISPLNLFNNPNRISSLSDLQDGHTIGIPSDPANQSRSLRFLADAGLIALDPANNGLVSLSDITEYVVNINITPLESGMLAGILPDIEAAVINASNAVAGGLSPMNDSIFREDIHNPRAEELINVIVVRTQDMDENGERAAAFNAIVRAFNTDRVANHILSTYDGAFLPMW